MRWKASDLSGLRIVGDTGKRAPESVSTARKASYNKRDYRGEKVPQSERQGPANGREDIYLPVTPYGKPRMTRRDQWAKRPAVIRYRAFCDAVRAAWPAGVPYPAAGAHVTFWLPMPKSWSKRKRDAMRGQPHQQKPDRDNLEKALMDAMCEDDAHVWDGRTTKRWADTGYITITTNEG